VAFTEEILPIIGIIVSIHAYMRRFSPYLSRSKSLGHSGLQGYGVALQSMGPPILFRLAPLKLLPNFRPLICPTR